MKRTILLIATMCWVAYALFPAGNSAMADPIQPEEPQYLLCKKVPMKAWGDPAEIQKQIEDLGYTITNVRIEKGCWEVKAFDANDQVYEFYVDPVSKDIVLKRHKPSKAEKVQD